MEDDNYTYRVLGPGQSDRGYNLSQNATATSSTPQDGRSISQLIWVFAGPVIFFVGIVGNALILLVMAKKRMRGTTTSVYLRLMAFADLCVLITGMIPEWLEQADILVFKYIHPATCKLEKFTFYTSADTAIWILVIFTVDRFIAVCFPLEKKDYCLPSRSKYFATGALLLAVTKNFHVFWTRGAEYITVDNSTVLKSNCGRPTPEFKYFEFYVRPWIAFTTVNALPFCVILVCNIFIIRALIAVKKLRSEQAIVSNSDRQLFQMSLMCLSASFSFLVCITPSIILLIGRPHWTGSTAYDISKGISNQLVYVNHSINFFLYCVTGKRFRVVLVHLLTKFSGGGSNDSMDTRTTVYRTTIASAKINAKNGNLLTGSIASSTPRCTPRPSPMSSPKRTIKALNKTPEASPFLTKKNTNHRNESSL
ncbi:hypothetical protein CAPTEDRAFT_169933 [Capitella teleta]|uniref:G-protein coupled receptors family 1 profile domain-containing protein n=1 Tax=Capitella teleta TaxID=283909 RepID=R7UUD3_CAPTE|nr:hypothetical protein CAPTEDRAFT_169933 [Capitella teleta]|eukprot:ELU09778.1 hypothetical protein CAPTEDRAFT_169933 [Capitella teleta]